MGAFASLAHFYGNLFASERKVARREFGLTTDHYFSLCHASARIFLSLSDVSKNKMYDLSGMDGMPGCVGRGAGRSLFHRLKRQSRHYICRMGFVRYFPR